jgi:hypothetical protein
MKLHIETQNWTIQGSGDEILTYHEFRALEWPPCPVCGSPTTGYPIQTRSADGGSGMRVSPMWNCRKGCHPGQAAIGGEPTNAG